MIDLDELRRLFGSTVLSYVRRRLQSPQLSTARMGSHTGFDAPDSDDPYPGQSRLQRSLGHRFYMSNKPVKTDVKLSL